MESWVRSAFSRTAEAASSSGRTLEAGIQRAGAIAGSLGSVLVRAGDAVERGAKMVLEQAESAVVNARYNDFRHAVRRMEEAALAFGDAESDSETEEAEDGVGRRKAAMRRWLAALEELEARSRVPEPGAAAKVAESATSDTTSAAPPGQAGQASGPVQHGTAGPAAMPSGSKEPATGESATTGPVTGDETSADATTAKSSSGRDDADHGEAGKGSVRGQDPEESSALDGTQATSESSALRSGNERGLAAADADVAFYDGDPSCSEPLSFRDVFLESLALEHIVMSLIAEPGDAEEWALLRKLFHLCLVGTKEECNQLASAIEELAQAFSSYSDTKLSGDALLDMVSDTVTALKIRPQLQRLRDKSSRAVALLAESSVPAPAAESAATGDSAPPNDSGATSVASGDTSKGKEKAEGESRAAEVEGAKGTQGSRPPGVASRRADRSQVLSAGALWLDLQRQQHALQQKGDTPGDRLLKIEKVSSAARELQESATSMSSGIADCRKQREEALTYQSKRAMENKSAEKVALGAFAALEAKRNELQRQLDEVSASMAVVQRQLQKLAEEKEQFYAAGAQTVDAFESEGALRAHQSGVLQADAHALKAWQGFLESSWPLEVRCQEAHQRRLREECTAAMPRVLPIAKAQLSQCQRHLQECTDRLQRQVISLEQTTAIRKAFEERKQKGAEAGAEAEAVAGDSDLDPAKEGEKEGKGGKGGDGKREGTGASSAAEEMAVARKQAEQEEDYLMCEFKSKAAAGEAMQAASEIQGWIDWAALHSSASKERKEWAEVKELIEAIKSQVQVLQGIPRPVLTRDDPSQKPMGALGALGALGRYPESKSWRLDSIGSVLHSGIVVAPVLHARQGLTATEGGHTVTRAAPVLDVTGDGAVTQGDADSRKGDDGGPDQLPTPTVISGKRRNLW